MTRKRNSFRRYFCKSTALIFALSGALSGTFCPTASFSSIPAPPSDLDMILELPEEVETMIAPGDQVPGSDESSEPTDWIVVARAPIGTLDLGDMSALSPADFVSDQIRVGIYSPWGWFPRYQIRARLLSLSASLPEDIGSSDYGFGVHDIVATNPRINPVFDYLPDQVSKDIDGVPNFLGTLQTLAVGSTQLFRTRGTFFGRWNYFHITVAVAPQYYTPAISLPNTVEIEIRILP